MNDTNHLLDDFNTEINKDVVSFKVSDPEPFFSEKQENEETKPLSEVSHTKPEIRTKNIETQTINGITEIKDNTDFAFFNSLEPPINVKSANKNKLDEKINAASYRYELPNDHNEKEKVGPIRTGKKKVRFSEPLLEQNNPSNTSRPKSFQKEHIIRSNKRHNNNEMTESNLDESDDEWFRSFANQSKVKKPMDPFVKEIKHHKDNSFVNPHRKNPKDNANFIRYVEPEKKNEREKDFYLDDPFENEDPFENKDPFEKVKSGHHKKMPKKTHRSSFSDDDESSGSDSKPHATSSRHHNPKSKPKYTQDSSDDDEEDDYDDEEYDSEDQIEKRRKKRWGHLRKMTPGQKTEYLLKEVRQLQEDGVMIEGIFDMNTNHEKFMDSIEAAEERAAEDDGIRIASYALVGIFYFIETTNYNTGEYLKIHGITKDAFTNRHKFNMYLRRIYRMYISGGGPENPIWGLLIAMGGMIFETHCMNLAAEHMTNQFNQTGVNPINNILRGFMCNDTNHTSQSSNAGQAPIDMGQIGGLMNNIFASFKQQQNPNNDPVTANDIYGQENVNSNSEMFTNSRNRSGRLPDPPDYNPRPF